MSDTIHIRIEVTVKNAGVARDTEMGDLATILIQALDPDRLLRLGWTVEVKTWVDHDADTSVNKTPVTVVDVPCPFCKAPVGAECRTRSGSVLKKWLSHKARVAALGRAVR